MKIEIKDVRTPDDVAEFMRWLSTPRSALAYDIETTGLSWRFDKIRLAQFGDTQTAWVLSYDDWRGIVRHVFRTYRGPIVGHNIRFDLHFTAHDLGIPTHQLDWTRIHDTMNMAQLIDPTRPKGLKPLAARYIHPATVAGQAELDADMRRGKWGWDTVPIDLPSYRYYAGLDTALTAILYELFTTWIQQRGMWNAYELEQMVSYPMFAMERHGMLLDVDYTTTAQNELLLRAEEIRTSTESAFGISNIGSNAQIRDSLLADGWTPSPKHLTPSGTQKLAEYLQGFIDPDDGEPTFEEPDLDYVRELCRTYPSLAADVLEDIADQYPLVDNVLRYRLATKAANTWLAGFLNNRDPQTGRVYPNIRQVAARTGRSSVADPPLQQVPREDDARAKGLPSIRDCFTVPEDHKLLSADFSNIEARIFAHFANETEMIRTIREGGDLHRLTAARSYRIPLEEVTGVQRQAAKTTLFSLLFGAGPDTIAARTGQTRDEAVKFLDGLYAAFPGIKGFQRQIVETAKNDKREGRVAGVTTHVGGRLTIQHDEPEYRLTNYLIQGTAAVVLKDRIMSLHNAGLTDMMLLPVHDEVLFEVPDEDVDEVRHLIEENMPDPNSFSVPLDIEVSKPVTRWGAAK